MVRVASEAELMADRTWKARDPHKGSEAAVLKAVKQLLEARGFRVFRRNTGAFRGEYRSKRTGKVRQRFVRFSEPGMADLWGWLVLPPRTKNGDHGLLGLHIEVEIKAPGRTPTATQHAWLNEATAYGAMALWCDSVEMCEEKLKEWGI